MSHNKKTSIQHKDYILYYKSRILVALKQAQPRILSILQKILDSPSPQKTSSYIGYLAQNCNFAVESNGVLTTIFKIIESPHDEEALIIKAVYQHPTDSIIIFMNRSFNPTTWESGAKELLDRLFKVLNVVLDHELIHRAQRLVEGKKFGLIDFLKSKLSIKWYLRNPQETKAYGNTLAHDLAYRGIYQAPEDIKGLYSLRSESYFLNGLFNLLERKKVNRRMIRKILVPIAQEANKWLAHYHSTQEDLKVPEMPQGKIARGKPSCERIVRDFTRKLHKKAFDIKNLFWAAKERPVPPGFVIPPFFRSLGEVPAGPNVLVEKIFERIRQQEFPHRPSRIGAIFLCDSPVGFCKQKPGKFIHRVEAQGKAFKTNAECYTEAFWTAYRHPEQISTIESWAREYWGGKSHAPFFPEIVLQGTAQVKGPL